MRAFSIKRVGQSRAIEPFTIDNEGNGNQQKCTHNRQKLLKPASEPFHINQPAGREHEIRPESPKKRDTSQACDDGQTVWAGGKSESRRESGQRSVLLHK